MRDTQNGTAMTVSLMTFFHYVPYIIISLFAGTFVDNHSKKKIMLASDSIAAICSFAMLVLTARNELQIWNIYLVNFIIGFMNAFQGPASAVAIGKIVPKEKLEQVSGMKLILVIDLMSFAFAFLILLFAIDLREHFVADDSCKKCER